MDHLKLLEERVLKYAFDSPQTLDGVLFIGSLGSFAENEHFEDYSDVDCLIIMDHSGPMYEYQWNLAPLTEVLESCYGTVSFLTHSLFDLKNYVSTPYLISYSLSAPIYQTPKWKLWNEISLIIKKRGFTAEDSRRYQLYMVRHDRFNIFRKVRADPAIHDLWVINSQLFDQVRWMVQFHGYFSQSKVSMLNFLKDSSLLSDSIVESVRSHYNIRDAFFTKGQMPTRTEIAEEYFATLRTLEAAFNYFLDQYDFMGPIPEERISM